MDFLTNADTSGGVTAGDMSIEQLNDLNKSLSAGYGSDMTSLSGGSALRIQSLDKIMQATVVDNKHFKLFNALAKLKATAVLDEWTEQTDIGGFLGDSFNDQDGVAAEANGIYNRQVGRVKYMTTYRKIPIVLQHQNNLVDPTAIEAINGAKQLLQSIEHSLFEGNESVTPKAFSGIRYQLENSPFANDHVIDMHGASLDSVDPIMQAAQTVMSYGNFGTLTDLYIPPAVQTDLNTNLDPAFRVALDNSPNSIAYGTHVRAIQTSWGAVATNNDVFIRDEKWQVPFELRPGSYSATAVANVAFKPASMTAVAGAGGSDSYWQSTHAGTYVYYVTGINEKGESQATAASSVVTVASGQQVTLTITQSASGSESGYVIYRGRKNGANALSDVREMVKVPKAGATTTFIDKNLLIPGTTSAFCLNLSPSDHAISWQQFMPMMKIPMAATNSPIIPWIQMICGYLRITKRNQHVLIKNIVPRSAVWKPFG